MVKNTGETTGSAPSRRLGGVGKGGALFGPDVLPDWVDTSLPPGGTDQTEVLGWKSTLKSVYTFSYFLWSPNLIWFSIAVLFHFVFPYDIQGAKSYDAATATTWLLQRFTINYVALFIYYGYFWFGLYVANWSSRKFVEGKPTAGNMAHDLWWWSMGVVQWTFWEYAMCRIWATGAVDFATNQQIVSSPKLLVLNIAWVLLVPIWRDLHFYFAHRFLHVRNMYRYCHSLHHRLTNPEVFSGLAMHPIEHLYYLSNAFTPALFLSGLSPGIFLWTMVHLVFAPGCGHSGWEDNWQADQYHHIHHATFESNYGSPFSAFIDQFFGTFRERLGKSKAYRGESSGADVDADPALAKKNDDVKTTKVWSATGYLGLPKSWDHAVYTAFWMSLFPLVWWGAISNQSADGLLVSMIGPVATSKVIAFIVAYAPVILATLLCFLSGDKLSWRWPFHKEKLFGTFGFFLILGWASCIAPMYHCLQLLCSPSA